MQSESVEKLVDRYICDWDFLPEKMEKEIRLRWEMSEEEKEKAQKYLEKKYPVQPVRG